MGARLQEIRAALKARLLNRTDAEDRVSTNRAERVWELGLPAICIYTLEEEDELDSEAPPSYWCRASVVVQLLLEGEQQLPLDDLTDQLGEQVSQLVKADPYLGGLALRAHQVRWQIAVRDEGHQPIAGARLTWEFTWHERAPIGDPGELAPWKIADTRFSLDPSEPIPD